MRPNVLRHASIMVATWASSSTSQTWAAISPSLPTRATVSVTESAFLPTPKTYTPPGENKPGGARHCPHPGRPPPPPTTSATLPSPRPATCTSLFARARMVEHDLACENRAEGNGFDGTLGARPFHSRRGLRQRIRARHQARCRCISGRRPKSPAERPRRMQGGRLYIAWRLLRAGTAIRRASKLVALRHNRSSLPCLNEPSSYRREHHEKEKIFFRFFDPRAGTPPPAFPFSKQQSLSPPAALLP